MAFFVYFVVLIIAAAPRCSGSTSSPRRCRNVQGVAGMISASEPNKVAKREADAARQDVAANKALTPVYPTNPGGVREVGADKAPAPAPSVAPAAPPPARETTSVTKGVAPAAAAAEAARDLAEARCQNSRGRTVVEDAAPAAPAVQAVAQQGPGHCDVQACSNAYQSFRASDCTYQPYEGPRRACVAPPVTQASNDPAPTRALRQTARAAMAPDAAPRLEELRRGQSNNDDDYDDDEDDANAYGNANADAPSERLSGQHRRYPQAARLVATNA